MNSLICASRLCFLSLAIPVGAAAQHPDQGLISTASGTPVAYASVGVLGKPIGTVANAQGAFSLAPFTAAAPTDTVVVSCVGYQSRKVLVAAFSRQPVVQLQPQAHALQEVKVSAKGWKRHHIGRDGAWGITFYNFHLNADKDPAQKLGREVGTILHVAPGSYLEDAYVHFGQNDFKNLRFRLNVRALDAQDHPAASLLTRDILFTVANHATGWQHINLKPYEVNVAQQKRVAITLEWLGGAPDVKKDWYCLTIPAALSTTHRMVFRDKPEDQWKVQPVNVSLYVTALSPKG
jgi:hypothetical protein